MNASLKQIGRIVIGVLVAVALAVGSVQVVQAGSSAPGPVCPDCEQQARPDIYCSSEDCCNADGSICVGDGCLCA
jgi:hypothetical protein